MKKTIILFTCLGLLIQHALAQHGAAVSSSNSPNSNPFYSSLSTYSKSHPNVIGSPFLEEKWIDGKIKLKAGEYDNLKIKLDLLNDEVFVKVPKGDSFIVEKSLVSEFTFIGPHHKRQFKNLSFRDDKKNQHLGFFEILYSGKSEFMIKRLKVFREANSRSTYLNGTNSHELKSDKIYFIRSGGTYFKVHLNQKSIFSALNEFSEELSTFSKDHKLKLGKEEDVVRLLGFYDSMLNE